MRNFPSLYIPIFQKEATSYDIERQISEIKDCCCNYGIGQKRLKFIDLIQNGNNRVLCIDKRAILALVFYKKSVFVTLSSDFGFGGAIPDARSIMDNNTVATKDIKQMIVPRPKGKVFP